MSYLIVWELLNTLQRRGIEPGKDNATIIENTEKHAHEYDWDKKTLANFKRYLNIMFKRIHLAERPAVSTIGSQAALEEARILWAHVRG